MRTVRALTPSGVPLLLALLAAPGLHAQAPVPRPPEHLTVERVTLGVRYRYLGPQPGVPVTNQAQYRVALRTRLAVDRAGRFALVAGASTGARFVGAWNRTGVGTGDRESHPWLKHLYVTAGVRQGMTVDAGGLDVRNGMATDLTGLAGDGYLMGGRVRLATSALPLVDEAMLTVGHLGDLRQPSVFRRLRRLDEVNYGRLILAHHGRHVGISADVSIREGRVSAGQAVRVRMPHRLVDLLTLEAHQGEALSGGITAERGFLMRGRVSAGVASIRGDLLNASRYGEGTRMFAAGRIPLPADWSVTLYWTQALSGGRNADPRHRLDLGLSWR